MIDMTDPRALRALIEQRAAAPDRARDRGDRHRRRWWTSRREGWRR
ncbi:MAG: hypothetical protein MZV65_52695 [Chromatiales bacterium]|nr:hypothetical protein [Chromatiales bacterium]